MLAQRMGKRRIVAETGAGQHGVGSGEDVHAPRVLPYSTGSGNQASTHELAAEVGTWWPHVKCARPPVGVISDARVQQRPPDREGFRVASHGVSVAPCRRHQRCSRETTTPPVVEHPNGYSLNLSRLYCCRQQEAQRGGVPAARSPYGLVRLERRTRCGLPLRVLALPLHSFHRRSRRTSRRRSEGGLPCRTTSTRTRIVSSPSRR
jgi:hypothetical protein